MTYLLTYLLAEPLHTGEERGEYEENGMREKEERGGEINLVYSPLNILILHTLLLNIYDVYE